MSTTVRLTEFLVLDRKIKRVEPSILSSILGNEGPCEFHHFLSIAWLTIFYQRELIIWLSWTIVIRRHCSMTKNRAQCLQCSLMVDGKIHRMHLRNWKNYYRWKFPALCNRIQYKK